MKSTKKIIIIFFILAVYLPVISMVNSSLSSNSFKSLPNFETQVKKNVKRAGYWNLTGTPISIDDNNPTKNWSYTANTYDWCSGNGSWNNPYIIENVTINGQGSGSCIEIKNSDEYFIIRNCTLYGSGSVPDDDGGIKLFTVSNGNITDNNCSLNNGNGIFLYNSNKIRVSENIVNENTYNGIRLKTSYDNAILGIIADHNHIGISMYNVNFNNVSENIANNNLDDGLNLHIGTNNTILGNTIFNNEDSGIYINNGYQSKIKGNFIDNNKDSGIHIYDTLYCEVTGNNLTNNNYGINLEVRGYHIISKNNVSYNKRGLYSLDSYGNDINNNTVDNNKEGIYLENSNNTDIMDNNMSNNKVGLFLKKSNNNYISNNDLCGNTEAVQEEGCERNDFEKNKCYKNGVPPENILEILIIIVICIAGATFAIGMYVFRKKSSREEMISESILSSQELEELRKTEAEVSVKKEHHVCVVHKGKIVGAIYLCPECETYYCMKCAIVLKEKGENCWVCNNEIEL
jgi:parallel beta-helix repeat protein